MAYECTRCDSFGASGDPESQRCECDDIEDALRAELDQLRATALTDDEREALRWLRKHMSVMQMEGVPMRGAKPHWRDRIRELRDGGFKVCFNQGINARMLNDETAEAIASVQFKDDQMRRPRIYTAWDGKKDERVLFRGLEALVRAGVKADWIMVYMLIGHAAGETHADRDYRRAKLRQFGARPYPMPFVRSPELVGFQRWVVGAYDKRVPWEQWAGARYSPRQLRDRVTLPLFAELQCTCEHGDDPCPVHPGPC